MLISARDASVKRFVFATSSSTYGDEPTLPKIENKIGRPLSPYAATKYINEVYADVFARCYGLQYVGLRYFNVFGKWTLSRECILLEFIYKFCNPCGNGISFI